MGDQNMEVCMEDPTGDVDMSSLGMVCDNYTILKELSNIANSVKTEEILEFAPTAKLKTSKRVKWVPMFNWLKQWIQVEMVQEMNAMWRNEDMPQRLEALEKQKEKFGEFNTGEKLWRPQLGDVKAQLKAGDVAHLQKLKILLESQAKDYENKVDRLKKTMLAKRGYIKALQMDIQKYQKKNEDYISRLHRKIENHDSGMEIIPKAKDLKWVETDFESKNKTSGKIFE